MTNLPIGILGPDGSTDYTATIAECLAVVWNEERVRVTLTASAQEPVDDVMVVCTTDEGLVDRVFGGRAYVQSYMATWDPFATTESAPSWAWHGFTGDAQWSTFVPADGVQAKLDRYLNR